MFSYSKAILLTAASASLAVTGVAVAADHKPVKNPYVAGPLKREGRQRKKTAPH